MGSVAVPVREPARLAAVRATGLVGAAPDAGIDRLTALAASLLRVPVARVTLVDDRWSHRLSVSGRGAREVDRRREPVGESFCRHVVAAGDRILVDDAVLDERSRRIPWVVSHRVAAWAGAPIRSSEGAVIGALCVTDDEPRRWTRDDAEVLTVLAQAVSSEVALRAALRREREARDEADYQAGLLRAAHEATPDGVLLVSPQGRIVSYNPRFGQMWGIPDGVLRSGSDDEALASVLDQLVEPKAFLARVRAIYAARLPAREELLLRDGRVFDRYGTPLLTEDGAYRGYAWYFRDVTSERRATGALAASEARYRSLVRALTSDVWYASADGRLLSDMPAWRAVTGQSEEALRGHGWLAGVHPDDRDLVRAAWAHAVETRSTYEVTFRIRPCDVAPEQAEAGTRILEVRGVPLERDGAVMEWVGVFVDVTGLRRAEAERERLAGLAAAAADRTRALQQVTAALSGAVTMADVLTVILEQGQAGSGATGSGVAMRDGDRVRYHVLNGYSADIKAAWSEFSLDLPSPVTWVLRHEEPLFIETQARLLAMFDTPEMRTFAATTGEQALARLPLRTSAGVVGVVSFGFTQPRVFSTEEREFLVALAGQCAQALDRAQLYERERKTAMLLQRSLLPEALPTVPGVRLAARCQPATLDVDVGGDWYDALVLPDGRLAVVVGDVMGKGVRAASVMGQIRNALRGLVHADPCPVAVLGWLDAVVTQLGADEELVTIAYGVLDPREGTFDWACAGHPPPLLLSGEDALFVECGESMPLGMGGDRSAGRLLLGESEALLLYTDGLVESRARPLVDGLPQLQDLARRLARTGAEVPAADVLCDQLVAGMADVRQDDDVTLLLLRRDGPGEDRAAGGRGAHLLLPAKATSASAARRYVADHLSEWRLDAVRDDVLLCVSEIVTNAVVHAASYAELWLRHVEGLVRVEVRDAGRSMIPVARRPSTPEDTDGRGLQLVEAVADRWGVVEELGGKVVWFELAAG